MNQFFQRGKCVIFFVFFLISLDSAYSTNSMNIGPPPPLKDPNMFAQNIPSFMLAAPPPPPPPPPVAIEPNFNMPPHHQMNHLPPLQATPPPPFHSGPPPPNRTIVATDLSNQPPVSAGPVPFLGGPPPNIQQPPPMQPPFEGKTFRNKPKNVCRIGDFTIALSILCVWACNAYIFLFKYANKKSYEQKIKFLKKRPEVDGVLCSFFRKQLSKRKSNESQLRKY